MYKFNGGYGAVICDKCRRIIDENISYDEYKKSYEDPVICWRCKALDNPDKESKEHRVAPPISANL